MRKNPYISQSENLKLDARSQNIIKKARRYGVVVYDNPTIGKALLNPNEKTQDFKFNDMKEFFLWFLQLEKTTQMSEE